MNILFGLFSAALFFDCVFLVFLVLLQLPKKEAGAGMAFGGAATDALFGAGSGNALTTITRYAAGVFFGLALLLTVWTSQREKNNGSEFINALTKSGPSAAGRPAAAPAAAPSTALGGGADMQPSSSPGLAPAAAPASSAASNTGALPSLDLPAPAAATNK
jgi:protein translocase SecG subunit